jgi:hypothetical protein
MRNFDELLAFAYRRAARSTPQGMVDLLSVEGMVGEKLPSTMTEDLTAFRHLRTDVRLRKAEQWHTRRS